jgi:PPOX class probable FMN-dependent enzyme
VDVIHSVEELRLIYKEPPPVAMSKLHALDKHCISWIAHSPLVFIATSDADGNCDCGPKGGPPGFVKILDSTHLAIADLSGNNKIDNMRNLVTSSGIGMVFLIPGIIEVLRVNGRARITTDNQIAEMAAIDGVVPRVTLVIEVHEAYVHCGKALRRAGIWDSGRWPDTSDMPSYGAIIKDHKNLTADAEVLDVTLEEAYGDEWLWKAGGDETTSANVEPLSWDIEIGRPLPEILAFLANHEHESEWLRIIKTCQLSSSTSDKIGATYVGTFELMGSEVPMSVELIEVSDSHLVYRLEVASEVLHERFILTEDETGTRLTMLLDAGEMTKVMAPLLSPDVEAGLLELKAKLEVDASDERAR